MKKAFQIIGLTTLVGGLVAWLVCRCVLPQEVKEFLDRLVAYLNTPISIGVGCSITIGGIILIILRYTSIGSKGLKKLKKRIADVEEKAKQEKELAKEYKELAEKQKADVLTILSNYSQRIDDLLGFVLKVCETSPNAKIKALGVEYTIKAQELKQELTTEIEKLDKDYVGAIQEKESVKELQSEIKTLTEQVERLVKQYGEEREETIDSDTEEE